MVYSEQYLAHADSTYYEDIQVLLKTLNHLLLSHAATPIQQRLVKFWNFLCSALGACFILFCPLKGHLMLWSWGCYCSAAKSCLTLWDPMGCSIPGIPVLHWSWSLLKLMSIESMMPSNHFILCQPFLLLPSVFPSIRVSSHHVAKVLELQLQHQGLPMNI